MLNYQRVKLLFPVNVPLFGAKKPMTGGLATSAAKGTRDGV